MVKYRQNYDKRKFVMIRKSDGTSGNLICEMKYRILKFIPRKFYPIVLSYEYQKNFKKKLNLKKPKTFTEKLQYLKLYETDSNKSLMTDKLYAKKYVKKLIPEILTAEVYDVADSFDKLNFDVFPNQFVLKTNHSCKTCTFIYDKNNITKSDFANYSRYYKNALNTNFAFLAGYELQYEHIKPVVFAEELLSIKNETEKVREYEAYCFCGKVEFVRITFNFKDVDSNTFRRFGIWDKNGNPCKFSLFFELNDIPLSFNPESFNKVVKYSEIISENFDFVRVDFFETENKLFFLETTFTPFSGFIKFLPDKYDELYGEKLKI